ncbi:MAG: glycosyltransferase family 4 protein [Prevotella sp.]|nr:glycosyltransferase family 4 protein [Prevotella sp.]
MNILIVVAHLRKGGLVDVIYNICNQLTNYPTLQIQILTLRNESEQNRLSDFKGLGIKVSQLHLTYVKVELNTGSVTNKVQHIVDEARIDIVHCHGYHAVLACAKLKGVRIISTLHDRAQEDFINSFGNVLGQYMLSRYFKALKKFNMNIAVSESTAQAYRPVLNNVTFVNNGVDTARFTVGGGEENIQLKERLGIEKEQLVLISTGRVEKEKGFEELIEWFINELENSKATLIILGDGNRWQSCKLLAKGHSHVILPGRVDDVETYLKASDFYISNSKSEGMSLAVCEGMSCGLFPILSDIPSHHDAADGVGGIFFQNLKDLRLNSLFNLHPDKKTVRNYVVEHFSREQMALGYVQCYSSLETKRESF